MLFKAGFLKAADDGAPSAFPNLLLQSTVIDNNLTDLTTYTSAGVTPQSGTNRCAILVVMCSNRDSSTFNIAADWGGTSFTMGAQNPATAAFNPASAILYMKDADIPASSQTISVTVNADTDTSDGLRAILFEYEDVDQTTTIGDTDAPAVSLNPTGSITTTAADSVVISVACDRNNSSTDITGSTGTEVYETLVGSSRVGGAIRLEEVASSSSTVDHEYDDIGFLFRVSMLEVLAA